MSKRRTCDPNICPDPHCMDDRVCQECGGLTRHADDCPDAPKEEAA